MIFNILPGDILGSADSVCSSMPSHLFVGKETSPSGRRKLEIEKREVRGGFLLAGLVICSVLGISACQNNNKVEHCAVEKKNEKDQKPGCAVCNNGYFIAKDLGCSKCDGICRLCEYDAKTCTGCFLGKFVSNNTCMSCPQNCDFCNGANNCIRCEVGYFVLPENTACGQCPPNCASCWSSETCGECKSGFTLVTKKDQQLCIRAGLGSMVYTLIGGTLIIVSLYCLTSWWKNRQNRLIAEGEKLMNEPNSYPSQNGEVNRSEERR